MNKKTNTNLKKSSNTHTGTHIQAHYYCVRQSDSVGTPMTARLA